MKIDFLDKNMIVIGGTSGIGETVVKKLYHEYNANVIFCGRNKDKGEAICKSLEGYGKHILRYFPCDVRSPSSVNSFFLEVRKLFPVIHGAFNNAGIVGEISSFHQYDDQAMLEVMQCNFFGMWYCLKEEIKMGIETEELLSIVNMASTSGLIGNGLKMTPYASSKHAVVGLTKSLALEYAKTNIRINAICPGFTNTDMVETLIQEAPHMKMILPKLQPIGRIAKTEEVANNVVFLLSDFSSYNVGSTLIVDGGLTT